MVNRRLNEDDLDQYALIDQLGGGNSGTGQPTSSTQPAPVTPDPTKPRIVYRDGKHYLLEHGNERWLQGREVSDAQGYVTSLGGEVDPVRGAYRQYLGREADDEGLRYHSRNPGGQSAVIDLIKNSPEAKAYAASIANVAQGPGPNNPDNPGPLGASQTTQGASGASGAGGNSGLGGGSTPFEGFDFQRAQDPSFSAKDSFAKAASAAGEPPPGLDKPALGAWFDKYIRPSMEADGHKINWVDGDKMSFTSPQGTFVVDWVRGAGADGFAFAWQVESGTEGVFDQQPAASSASQSQSAASSASQSQSAGSGIADLTAGLASSDFYKKVLDEVAKAARGESNTLNMDALLNLMKG